MATLADEQDFEVVGAASSAEEALDLVQRAKPDVALLDLELRGMSGTEAIPRISSLSPTTSVLIFTAYESDERVLEAVRGGARGYLLKGATAAEISDAMRVVAARRYCPCARRRGTSGKRGPGSSWSGTAHSARAASAGTSVAEGLRPANT